MWNVYDRPQNLRTANACESRHASWNRKIGINYPSLWVEVKQLKKQEKITKKYTQKSKGEPPPPQKKVAFAQCQNPAIEKHLWGKYYQFGHLLEKNRRYLPKFFKKKNVDIKCLLCIIYSIQNSSVIFGFGILCSFKLIVSIGDVILCSFLICETWLLRKNFVGPFLFIAATSKMPDP